MITSVSNAKIKNVMQLNQKAKARREQGLFVAEGRKMFLEAPESWVSQVFISETVSRDGELMSRAEKYPCEIVKDSVFRQMCDTKTPQGILTVLKLPSWSEEEVLAGENPLVMVLEDLQDPGNAGTILRTGEGAGVSGVFLTKTCVDITNPKVIRSTMGSVLRVPFVYAPDLKEACEQMKKAGIRLYAAHLKGMHNYDQEDYTKATGFLIGNEAKGLTDEMAAIADTYIKIHMAGQVESLNAAVASSVLMFEAARQRRNV